MRVFVNIIGGLAALFFCCPTYADAEARTARQQNNNSPYYQAPATEEADTTDPSAADGGKPALGNHPPGTAGGLRIVTGPVLPDAPSGITTVSYASTDEPPAVPATVAESQSIVQPQPAEPAPESVYVPRPVPFTSGPAPCRDRWFSVETMLWWTSRADLPELLTTSPQGTPANQAGILPNGQVLLGATHIYDFPQRAFRIRGGKVLDSHGTTAVTAEFLMLINRGHKYNISSTGDPILARPFTNLQTGQEDSQLLAYPGVNTGSFAFDAETRMYSVAAHLWTDLTAESQGCGEDWSGTFQDTPCRRTHVGLQVGPRFMHLDDTLLVDEAFTSLASGRNYLLRDSFKTENSFLGGEIGLRATRQRGMLDVDLGVRLAVGGTRQELDINGFNTVVNGNTQTTNPGGFLAHESNSGNFDRTQFSLIPSFDVGLGLRTNNGWRFNVSYNFIYWTNVIRAAEQIDLAIDETAFLNPTPNPAGRPEPLFREADYLAHGISVGIEKTY